MWKSLTSMLGLAAWHTRQEVWARCIGLTPADPQFRILFSTTPQFARSPIFLQRWSDRAIELALKIRSPQSDIDWRLADWIGSGQKPGDVRRLSSETDLGFDMFGATLEISQQRIAEIADIHDINRTTCRLTCAGLAPEIHSLIDPEVVARERLTDLKSLGAQPVVAVLVQAAHLLYQSVPRSGPGLAVFTMDRTVPLEQLRDIAHAIAEIKSSPSVDPVLRYVASIVHGHEQRWSCHRRVTLPPQLTYGRLIHAGDLWIHRPFLNRGLLVEREQAVVPCLAISGEEGGIEVLPRDWAAQCWAPNMIALFA